MDQPDDLDAIWTTNARLSVINSRFPYRLLPFDGCSPFSVVYLISCIHIALYGSKSRRLTRLLGSKCDLNDMTYLRQLLQDSTSIFQPTIHAPPERLIPEYLELILEYALFEAGTYPRISISVKTIWFATWKGYTSDNAAITTPRKRKIPAFSRAVVEGYYYQNTIATIVELDTEHTHYRVGFLVPHLIPNTTSKKPQYYMGDRPIPDFSELMEMQNNVRASVIDLDLPIFRANHPGTKMVWSPGSSWRISGLDRLYSDGSEPVISKDKISLGQIIDYSLINWTPLPTGTTDEPPEHTVAIDHTFLCYIRSIPDNLLLYMMVVDLSAM